MISPELQSFLESGVSLLIGTRDARMLPACMRAFGARVEPGGRELTVFLPDATSGTTLANLRDNARIAVAFSRVQDHYSLQLKGRAAELRPAAAAESVLVQRYCAAFAESLAFVGMPPATTLRMAHWPSHAVRVAVESLFAQTPGPGAGDPLRAPAGGAP